MRHILDWIRRCWLWLKPQITPSDAAWTGATFALFGFWVFLVLAFIGLGLFPRFTVGSALGLAAALALFALISALLLLALWLVSLLRGRYRAALLLSLLPAVLVMLTAWYPGGVLLAGAVVFVGLSLFFGAGASLLLNRRRDIATLVYLVIGTVLLGGLIYLYARPASDPNPALAAYHLKGQTLALPDPGKPGPHKVTYFTYGSGKDPYRPEYAKGARLVTGTVDASKLDKQWTGLSGWVRTLYWGFGPNEFPVQGRVWMPADGRGPFPLVLIVHGNHTMEDFSDPGYAYLGELLASQGFILVSVDENFLNSSIADLINPFAMRNGAETRVRGWMLLQHLAQWRKWNADPKSPLYGKADMDHIGLMGHSRGGEAVAVANAFNTLKHYPEDATLPFDFGFHIGALVAIAPADGQYQPRHRPTPMRDANYFTIHGSMDGDVTSFMGSSQYSRATYSPESTAFKSSLYVTGANHGQFNTSWGRNDISSAPTAYFIDERPIMDPEAQRRIAKVYISAFLHATLKGQQGYRPLFEDARNGAAWLPDVFLINNYADGRTRTLVDGEEDLDPSTGRDGTAVRATNISVWRETWVERKDDDLDSQAILLAWDARYRKGGSYILDLPPGMATDGDLVFSLSRGDFSTLPDKFEPPKGSKAAEIDDKPLDWHVVAIDSAGHEARLALSHDQPLYPQVKANTRRIPEFSAIPTSEIVMRRYRFALADFARANPALDTAHLKEIRFVFDMTPRGAIVLDDVGLAPAR